MMSSNPAYDDFDAEFDAELEAALSDEIDLDIDPKLAAELEAELEAQAQAENDGQLPGMPEAKPARDEYLAGLSDYDDLNEAPEAIYHSKIFCLSQAGGAENDEYHRFVNELLNEKILHNRLFQGRDPVTTWTREGDLMVWVEWVVFPSLLPENLSADTMEY
jgi:hypothetical protein